MPIYEFECKDCQSIFEVKRPISKMYTPTVCPCCSSNNTQRRFCTPFAYLRTPTPTVAETPNSENAMDGILLHNVRAEYSNTGIKANNVRIRGKNVTLKGNRVGLDAENSDISIEDLKIE